MKLPFSNYDFFGYLACGFLVVCATDYAFDGHWVLGHEKVFPADAAFWILVAYMLGHLIAQVSSATLENWFVNGILGDPADVLLGGPSSTKWRKLFPGYFIPLPNQTRQRVFERAAAKGVIEAGRPLYFHCHPIVIREKHVLERMNSFLNMYGFCRNMSMSILLCIPVLLLGIIVKGGCQLKLLWTMMAIIAAVGMFWRYLKFYRLYSVEVFRSYAENDKASEKKDSSAVEATKDEDE